MRFSHEMAREVAERIHGHIRDQLTEGHALPTLRPPEIDELERAITYAVKKVRDRVPPGAAWKQEERKNGSTG